MACGDDSIRYETWEYTKDGITNKLNSVDQGTFPFYRSEDIEEERLEIPSHPTQTDRDQ